MSLLLKLILFKIVKNVHAYLIYGLSGYGHWQTAVWRRPCKIVLRERERER